MIRVALILCLTAACLFNLNAQETANDPRGVQISAGVGLLSTFVADNATTNIPPLSLRLGYRVSPLFSISAYAGYSSTESGDIVNPNESISNYTNDYLILGIQPAIHSTFFDNWDIYGGFLIGYNIPTVDSKTTQAADQIIDEVQPTFARPAENTMTFSGFVGANYFLNKNIGVFGEVGYGISLLTVGVNFKL